LEKIENANTEVVEQIREKIESGQFEYSQHATDQSIRRQISVTELRDAMRAPELVEDYPNAKYGPSCLLLGFTNSGRPLHVNCSHGSRELVKIITLYEPSPMIWLDFRIRSKENG